MTATKSNTRDAAADWPKVMAAHAERLAPNWIELRRRLHRFPELSEHEFATTQTLLQRFGELELPVHCVGDRRGLTCDLITDSDDVRPRLGIRGDIDGLPIQDAKAVDYRSLNAGVMHACGHDVHAAVVYGAINLLRTMQREATLPWPVSVRAILQPAEELATGARYMIQHHVLRDLSAVLSLHVDPTRPVGTIGLKNGVLTANCDIFHVHCRGQGGHGARPHLTRDPIDALTRWVQSVYRRVDRASDPADTVVISIGKLSAGHSANVIPDTAELEGTLRTLTPESRSLVLETVADISAGVARETQCEIDFQLKMSAPAVLNQAALVDHFDHAVRRMLGAEAVQWIDRPSMGSEDFSFYLEHVPGAMLRLGVAGEQVGRAPLHTPLFDVDERAIANGAKVLAATAILYFQPVNS